MFITFEGIDGAGKSSHIAPFVALLKEQGHEVIVTREPGGTVLGERLRELILNTNKTGVTIDPEVELMLVYAARKQNLKEIILPALQAGKTVVSDRFHDSSYAFQGGGSQVDFSRIDVLNEWCGVIRPDVTFLFDIKPDEAHQRMHNKRLDRFESEAADFHQRVRNAYIARAVLDDARFMRINASRPIEEVFQQVVDAWESFGNTQRRHNRTLTRQRTA